MKEFKSPWKSLQCEQEKMYHFLSDFRNFNDLMPDEVEKWEATEESCSFSLSGLPEMSLKFGKKEPFQFIEMIPDGKSPVAFSLLFGFEENEGTKAIVVLSADLNPMLVMMASRPLGNFVNMVADKLADKSSEL